MAAPIYAHGNLNGKTSIQPLIQSQYDLLLNGNFSDCTVECKGIVWRAHRCTLRPRSAYFSSALGGNFQEGTTGVVTMDDDEPYAIEGVLLYLYTFVYPTRPTLIPGLKGGQTTSKQENAGKCELPGTRWEMHLSIFKLADKLGLEDLRVEAQKRLLFAMDDEWQMSNFHELLEQLWERGQPGVDVLREAAMKLVSVHAAQLMASDEFRVQLIHTPLFTASLAARLVQERTALNEKKSRYRPII